MSKYRLELARPEDDADLRQIMAATPMDGFISVGFRREPSWFAGAVVDGQSRQVVVCRDTTTGRVIGFGCRSLREVLVNGEPKTIGYLSSLRLLKEYRSLGLVARGYAFFRELHQDGRTPLYVTTIAAGNEAAQRVLTAGRAGLPMYHADGSYFTFAIALPRRKRSTPPSKGMTIRAASAADLPALVEFLSREGARRQFFPRYRPEDFTAPEGLLCSLSLGNILLAERGGRIVGTLAAWDQHAYRQSIIHGYRGWMRWARPWYNLAARVRGLPQLPAAGEELRYLTAALPVVAEDDPTVFAALMDVLRARHASGASSHMVLGLHEKDPLAAIAKRWAFACYTTDLYLVCWSEGEAARAAVDGRPPYLELGSL